MNPANNSKSVSASRDEHGLAGNFVVSDIRSLVDPQSQELVPIPDLWIERMIDLANETGKVTLRWLSPLCAQLPPRFGRRDGRSDSRAGFFDGNRFPVADLLRRLHRRLTEEFGLDWTLADANFERARLVSPPGLDSLQWLKWQYGAAQFPKTLFGVMGRIAIESDDAELRKLLVLGQFSGVGEKTAFGLGRYVIEEVQAALPDHVPRFLRARRSRSMVDLAVHHAAVEQEAQRLGESPGHVRMLAKQVSEPEYQPQPVVRFLLPGDKARMLAVPSRAERAVQRVLPRNNSVQTKRTHSTTHNWLLVGLRTNPNEPLPD